MEIVIAAGAGFCFGVRRAVELAFNAARDARADGGAIYSLGPIIHNPQVVAELEGEGVTVIASEGEFSIPESGSRIILRSHGVPDPELPGRLQKEGIIVVDATCPYVKKAQVYARRLVDEGYSLVIVGDANHPEVKSILGHCGNKATVTTKDIKCLKHKSKIGIIAQTTQSMGKFAGIVVEALSLAEEIKILNTICDATEFRQGEAIRLAGEVDLMIVIGGKNSANTAQLADVCRLVNPNVRHVETETEIEKDWFPDKVKKVGITGGASTPGWMIDRAVERINSMAAAD